MVRENIAGIHRTNLELDKDEGVCYQARTDLQGFKAGERFGYLEAVKAYCDRYVVESFREEFMRFVSPDAVREGLRSSPVISYRYMIRADGREVEALPILPPGSVCRAEVVMG